MNDHTHSDGLNFTIDPEVIKRWAKLFGSEGEVEEVEDKLPDFKDIEIDFEIPK